MSVENLAERREGKTANNLENVPENMTDVLALVKAIDRAQIIIEIQLDGSILSANERFLKLFGYELNELKGKHHSILTAQDVDKNSEQDGFLEKVKAGACASGEYKYRAKDGHDIWLVVSCCPILDEAGAPMKAVVLATDITESKSELQVRMDIMNLTSIVSESDLKGDITFVNQKFTEIAKYSKEELMGRPHNIVRHPDMPKEAFKQMWATIGRGEIFRAVVKNRAKDGTPYYVDAVVAPIMGANKKPRKYIGVRYDITARELERQSMKSLFEAVDASFAYVEFDIEGKVLKCNKNFESIM
ncbi:MAG: PAS domain-containing protein, partial [Bdellovibrionales bacterium]|nr:PAS domain-containing protein [Bdellovibrionales bacterium]